MRNPVIFAAAIAAVFPSALLAQQQPPAAEAGAVAITVPGKDAGAAAAMEIIASVTAVDKATRTVTLKGPSGNTVHYVAGPEVKNFDQIHPGDEVAVRYGEAINFELAKTTSPVRERIEREGFGRAKPGEKPAGSFEREVTVVADVVSVDAAKPSITLRGPLRTVTLKVKDPEKIKNVKAGDQVQVTYLESVSIVVYKPGAKK